MAAIHSLIKRVTGKAAGLLVPPGVGKEKTCRKEDCPGGKAPNDRLAPTLR